ncbi:MAG: glycosyltransferase family 8 protein [Nanoarchaeota archaeon]
MDKVHVAFALDRKYIQHLSVALYSLLTNNRNLNFNVYLISDGIGKQELKRIEFICDKFKHKLVNTNVKGNIFDNLITNYHFTKAIYYKLLIPEYIDSEKVLFIDSDTVVNNSVSDLYSIDIGNAFLAAIENPGFYRHNQLCMDSNSKYFNSGIMFINSIKWREEKLYERVLEFIKIHSDNIRFPEQDGLNAVINGNWIPLPPKFNLQTSMLEKECSCFSKLELDEKTILTLPFSLSLSPT